MTQKHTPEPWVFNQEQMKIKGSGDYEGLTVIANVSPKMDYSRGSGTQCANAERIVKCVNACKGIENPEQFIQNAMQQADNMIELIGKNIDLQKENERLRNFARDISQMQPQTEVSKIKCFKLAQKAAIQILEQEKHGK
jgi:hypothetical protein